MIVNIICIKINILVIDKSVFYMVSGFVFFMIFIFMFVMFFRKFECWCFVIMIFVFCVIKMEVEVFIIGFKFCGISIGV